MQTTASAPNAASSPAIGHVSVNSMHFHPRFLRLIGAPEMTERLTFSIEAGGLLRCRAVYSTDYLDETAVKEWEVQLPRTSQLFKIINGELS